MTIHRNDEVIIAANHAMSFTKSMPGGNSAVFYQVNHGFGLSNFVLSDMSPEFHWKYVAEARSFSPDDGLCLRGMALFRVFQAELLRCLVVAEELGVATPRD